MMKESIRSNAPTFSSRRMVKEYVGRYYPLLLKAAAGMPCAVSLIKDSQAQAWRDLTEKAGVNDLFSH